MNKRDIRQAALEALKAMPLDVQLSKSKEAKKDLMKELKPYSIISIFESFDWEIDTKEVISALLKQGKTVAIPKVVNDQEMIMINKSTGWEIPKEMIEVVIVPCVAFYDNHRIGYGRGYYDRYLKDFEGKKVLYAFKEQEHKFTPDNHDVTFDKKIIK